MKKIDAIIEVLRNIYFLLKNQHIPLPPAAYGVEDQMTRQEVKDYLKISESTYKRKVKDGTLKPIKMPGGDRFYKHDLMLAFEESRRKGRV